MVFAAPDIDMDVFSSAINRIGPLAGKITVITSTNDRALALSGRIAGGMTRVGAAEKAAIERLGVRVIDASDAGWGIINHDLFLSNAEVQRVIRRSIERHDRVRGLIVLKPFMRTAPCSSVNRCPRRSEMSELE